MAQCYEPMDIDLSVHSNSAMDISYNSSSATDIDDYFEADENSVPPTPRTEETPKICPNVNAPQTNVKKFYINMQKEKKSYTISLKTKLIFSFFTLLLSIITYQIMNIQCSEDLNLDELSRNLSTRVYGQSRAMSSLIEALSVSDRSKILFFYGGTGVGKTLTASLILDQVGHYSNVYHYIMPSFMETFTTDCMIGLSVCKHTIVIVDDLNAKDINLISHIESLIKKSQDLGKEITVILIYNCDIVDNDFARRCDESFPHKLLDNFSDIDAFKKVVKFEQLTEVHLRKCIETELGNRKFNDVDLDKLIKNFNVSLDGCKGVYTKIKMLENP